MAFSGNQAQENIYNMRSLPRAGMSSKSEIISAIKTYLDRSNTRYAIMIDGDWGIGKTHFYKTEIQPLVGDYQAIYISLFGLKSIQDINDEIFRAISLQKADGDENFKGILSLNPEILENAKIGGTGYAVQFLIHQWKENSTGKGKPLLLCLDDLERWEGNFSICLSYINKLVEHEKAKCILVGNLSLLSHNSQKGFENAREKTIGHIYRFENKIDVVFNAALGLITFKDNHSSKFIKTLIRENRKKLSTILNQVNYKNIRTISEAIQLFEYIYNNNIAAMTGSRILAFNYFCSLLATLILLKKYFVDYELRDKLLNKYSTSNQGYAFLNELGYFDEDKPEHITDESKFLLETIFFRADKICLNGMFSIIKKGFYDENDFAGDFQKWEAEKPYEVYLDTHTLYHLEDAEVLKIINGVLHSVFVKKEITNPATLLLLTEHLTNDIQRGVANHNFEAIKNQFITLFKELYQQGLVDKSINYDLDFGSNRFIYCRDVYEIVTALNNDYFKGVASHNLTNFWLAIMNNPDDAIELFNKFKYQPIFSIYYNPQEVIDALSRLTNAQLFELISLINARNHDPECAHTLIQEREQVNNIAESINYSYQNKYGMKAAHLKQIAKILSHQAASE